MIKVRQLAVMTSAHVFECRSEAGEPILLLESEDEDLLELVRAAHTHIRAPHIAPVLEKGANKNQLTFRCDAIADLASMLATAFSAGMQAPYAAGISFNEMMMDTLQAAHEAPGGPYCLGELALSNLYVGPGGHCWLFGFGHNFTLRDRDGHLLHVEGFCQAPDVLLGMKPTPASDVYVVHALLRRLLPHLQILDVLTGAVVGSRPELKDVRDALIALDTDASATDPAKRPQNIPELRARYREIRSIARDMPLADDEQLRAIFSELAMNSANAMMGAKISADVSARKVVVPIAGEVDLSRRPKLWMLFLRLLEARRVAPGTTVPLDELCEVGWPGEKILPEAARARVYVAISSLRKLGLRDVIVNRGDGYMISGDVEV